MKFGDTLNRRSVQQWRSYNIDYTQAKKFIKNNTTPGNGKALSIPGTGAQLENDFENNLFLLLQSECARVSLFVRSKQYEIDSRLSSIERALDQITRRAPIASANPQRSLRFRQRLSKIESDLLNVGEEIQKLSRFTTINRTAVRKLTKKYNKWSGSATLGPRVEDEILGQPKCFSKAQLQHPLDRYAEFLERVRAPFSRASAAESASVQPLTLNPTDTTSQQPAIVRELDGDATSFDAAIDVGASEAGTQRAVFWVHKDNVMELKVLLLQHMQRTYNGSPSPSRSSSSRRDSATSLRRVQSGPGDGDLVVSFISDRDENGGKISPTSSIDAVWKPQTITRLYDSDGTLPVGAVKARSGRATENTQAHDDDEDSDLELAQSQFHQTGGSSQAIPVAQSNYKRSRFRGLQNRIDAGVWAALDEDIHFSSLSSDSSQPLPSNSSWSQISRLPHDQQEKFPHAVLTIIYAGSETSKTIVLLDKSHLVRALHAANHKTRLWTMLIRLQTEKVDRFSIETHTLASLFAKDASSGPPWLSLLDKDIRHVPSEPPPPRQGRQWSGLDESSGSSTLQGTAQSSSQSAGSNPNSPSNSVRFAPAHHSPPKSQSKLQQQPQKPYWNEYDFPEDDEDGGFAVYIDPDAPIFPGQKAFTRWYQNVTTLFSPKRQDRLHRQKSTSSLSADSTSSDEEANADADDERSAAQTRHKRALLLNRHDRHDYGALPIRHPPSQTEAYSVPTPNTSTLCLVASVCLLLVNTIMSSTSRKKVRGEVDVAVLIGVLASLIFAVLAAVKWWGPERRARMERGDLVPNYTYGYGVGEDHDGGEGGGAWARRVIRTAGDLTKVGVFVGVVVWCGVLGAIVASEAAA